MGRTTTKAAGKILPMDQISLTVDCATADGSATLTIPSGLSINQIVKEHLPAKKNSLVARLDGKLCDLATVVSQSAELALYDFGSEEGRSTFWHSSAHVLGNALVNIFKCKLVNGPPTEDGFYYDVQSDAPISTEDFPRIEAEMARIVGRRERFERLVMSREELLGLYGENEFKRHFVNQSVGGETSVYRNGEFLDMCRGPHLNNTGYIRAVRLTRTSSAYFLGDASNASLQRIYAVSFPSGELMKEYEARMERAREMDHRKIGREMGLFFFHKYSAGSCFWQPAGAHIYNKLVEFLRGEYRLRGFSEVITPNIYSVELWKESGHYHNYKENIYMVEGSEFALKPMNCPGHCVMFGSSEHSFKELPIRLADFGVLHRNEVSGALSGLTRVRRFQQDDAHIFCRRDQIRQEIAGCIDFLKHVYSVFGFKYALLLSTRPEKFLGEIAEWDAAEDALRDAITGSGLTYRLNEGDGAFYGPKIDIVLLDALGRKIQCATIQLDFQLPQRFGLKYTASNGASETPVIIHRAILGSIERMISILLESYGKRLPFWLTPRQIAIVPIFADEYALEIAGRLRHLEVKVYSDTGCTLNKNIRTAETAGYRVVCVVGRKEAESREINVRTGGGTRNMPLEEFIGLVGRLAERREEFEDAMLSAAAAG